MSDKGEMINLIDGKGKLTERIKSLCSDVI